MLKGQKVILLATGVLLLFPSTNMKVENKEKAPQVHWSQDYQKRQQITKTENASSHDLLKERLGVLSWYLLFCVFPFESILWLLASLPTTDPADVLGLVVFLGANILIQYLFGSKRLVYQRRLLAYLRQMLLDDRYQVFTSLTMDAWESQKAYIVLPSLLVPGGLVLFTSDILRGRFMLAFAQLRTTVYLCAALYLRTETAVRVFVSLHVPYQVCNLWLLPNASAILRRSFCIRVLVSSLSVEGLDEILLHCLPLMVWSKEYLLVFTMVALVVFPLELLGFRVLFAERIRRAMIVGWPVSVRTVFPLHDFAVDNGGASQLPSPSSRSSRLMFFSVTSVPMAVMGISFTSGFPQINHPQNLLRLIIIQCVFSASLVVLGLLLGSRFDDFIQPIFLKQRTKHQEAQDNDNNTSIGPPISKDVNVLMVSAWSLTCFVSFMRVETGVVVFVLGASTWAIVALYMKDRKNSITCRKLRRRLFIASHVALFYVCDPVSQPNMPIILALARALFVLDESATVSELAVELGLGSLLQIRGLMKSPPYTVFSVFLISVCSTLLSLASAAATENRCRLCEAVRKSENFLDHAIKQKYSGVGATLEGILEDERILKIMEAESKVNNGESRVLDLFDLLKSALHACHAGRDICHMSASVRKALVDPTRMDAFPVAIATILTDWKENGVFSSIHIHDAIEKANRVQLSVDRDLLRALLCNLAGDPMQASLEVSIFDTMNSNLLHGSTDELRVQGTRETAHKLHANIGVRFRIICQHANVASSGNKPVGILSTLAFSGRTSESRDYLMHLRGDVATLLGGLLLADDKSIVFGENLVKPDSPYPRSIELSQHLSPRLFSPKAQIVTISEISNRGLAPYVNEMASVQKLSAGNGNTAKPFLTTVRRTHLLQPIAKFRAGSGLLPNLTFAILDDNALVRKNVLRLVLQHALADRDASFATGKTLEETLFFPHLISSKKVNVAIIDENLEYDSASSTSNKANSGDQGFVISGTEIGRRARSRGFQGCLILHSANGELASHLPPQFDGFIEKTSRKDEFIYGIEQAWMRFMERQHSTPDG